MQREPFSAPVHGRRRFLGTIIAAAAGGGLAGCSGNLRREPPPGARASVEAPVLAVGDEWRHDVFDVYNGEKLRAVTRRVVAVEPERWRFELIASGSDAAITEVCTPGWRALQTVPAPALGELVFDPPLPLFDFPLETGRQWAARTTALDAATGRRNPVSVHARVRGWERVRVPAGEIETLVVARLLYLGDGDPFRTQTEVQATDWYAPSVRAVVRSDVTSWHYDVASAGDPGGPPLVRGAWERTELTGWSVARR